MHGGAGSWDGTLRLWDLNSGNTTRRFIGHSKDVLSVAFSVDNRQVRASSTTASVIHVVCSRRQWHFQLHRGVMTSGGLRGLQFSMKVYESQQSQLLKSLNLRLCACIKITDHRSPSACDGIPSEPTASMPINPRQAGSIHNLGIKLSSAAQRLCLTLHPCTADCVWVPG